MRPGIRVPNEAAKQNRGLTDPKPKRHFPRLLGFPTKKDCHPKYQKRALFETFIWALYTSFH